MGANPLLFLASLNGTLAAQDRNGSVTLTGAGAVRYAPASGARINYQPNPLTANATGWTANAGQTAAWDGSDGPSGISSGSLLTTITNVASDRYLEYWGSGLVGSGIVPGATTLTVSIRVKGVSGRQGYISPLYLTAANGYISESGAFFTYTGDWQVVSYSFTPSSGTHRIGFRVRVALSSDAQVGDVIRIAGAQTETGSSATDFVSGSTGGVWLDPITGILGTAHASPSVSQAVAWVEEGTTNTVPDPSFENATITNYWTAQGTAAISKVTTHAYISSNGGKVVCGAATTDGIHQLATSGSAASSGQSWTVSGRIRAFAAGDVGKTVKAAIIERTSGDAVVTTNLGSAITLTDAWQSFSYTVALSGGGTVAKATCGFMAGAAVAVDFVLDAVQLEQKAYATSYCDGSIGTGYAWTGTAHASSSTRTKASIVVSETNHASAVQGAFAAKFNRLIDVGASQVLFSVGNTAAATDFAAMNISNVDRLNFTYYSNNVQGGDAYRVGSIAVSTWYQAFADWSGLVINSYLDAEAVTAGTRPATTGTFADATYDLQIGSWFGTIGQLNGLIGPVAIANRPLTAKERAKLYALTSWAWGTLRGGRVGLLVPR